MSVLMHRCSCGHLAFFHERSEPSGECSARHGCKYRGRHVFGPPEYVPSYDGKTGKETPLVEPGTLLEREVFGRIRTPLCGCEECRALYADLTGAAA